MDQSNSMSNIQLTDKNLGQEIDDGITENEGGQSTNRHKMDIESMVNLAKGNLSAKRKRKKKKVKCGAGNNDEVKSRDHLNAMSYHQLSDKSLRQENDDKLAKDEGVQHTNQDMIDIETVNLTEVNMNQSMGQSHSLSKLQLSDTSFRQEICDKLALNVDVQHTNQSKVDIESMVNLAQGNVSAKRKWKKKKVKSGVGNNDEAKSKDHSNSMSYLQLSEKSFRQENDDKLAKDEGVQHTNQDMIDIETVNLTEVNMNQSMGQSHAMSKLQLSDTSFRQEICDKLALNVDVQHTNQSKVDIESMVNLAQGNVSAKRKRKKKKVKSGAGNNDEVKSRDHSNAMSYLQLSDKSHRQENDDKLAKDEGVQHTNQDMIDIGTVNLTEVNKNQSMGQSHAMSKLQLSGTSFRQELCDKLTENVDVQHTDQSKVDIESTVNLAEGNVRAKRKWKRKKVKSKAGYNDEVKSRDQSNSMSYLQLSDKSRRLEIDDKLAKHEGIQRTNQDMIVIETVNITEGNVNQSMGQSHAMSKLQQSDTCFRQEKCDKVDVPRTDQNKVDIESTVNLAEGNVSAKRKRKRKKIKRKTGNKDQLLSMDQPNLQSDNNLRQEMDHKFTRDEDVRSTDQKKMDIESPYNLAEGDMGIKRKRRKKGKSKVKKKDEVQSMNLANGISNVWLSKNKLTENDCTAQESNFSTRKEYKPCHSYHLDDMVEGSMKTASSEVLEERSVPFAWPMGLERKVFPCESQQKRTHNQIPMANVKFENVLNKVNSGIFVVEGITSLGPSGVKKAEFLSKDLVEYPNRPPTTTDRRKLLVLDVNGLLAYIVMPPPQDRRADINILRRAVFKRPFCDDFLKFVFQNFDVGIWSSRAKEVIDRIVDFLLGNLRQKLLFCWNMSQCTQSGFKTLENKQKPLVCKELRKIWESDGRKFSWKKGQYNESNTLLIDDSPYKSLLNPLHTAIFPHSYHYKHKNDNSLGPGGNLRVYLEGLLNSGNVQEYVEHHPFGQSAISETNVSWQFYSGVLQKFTNKIKARKKRTRLRTSSKNHTAHPPDKVVKS